MVDLTAARRAKLPSKDFAGPGTSFPINDPTHARLAIGGATRAENAGNISAGEAASIKAKARKKLSGGMKTAFASGKISKAQAEKRGYDTDD